MSTTENAHNFPRVSELVFDCADPGLVAAFWSALLGVEIEDRFTGPFWFFSLYPWTDGAPVMGFQHVPEPKLVKNRVHLDLKVDDLDRATRFVVSLGGKQLAEHQERGRRWRVMADPEGNEFCLTLD